MSQAPENESRWRRWMRVAGATAYLFLATAVLVATRLPLDRVLAAVAVEVGRQGGPALELGPARLGWDAGLHLESLRAEVRHHRGVLPVDLEDLTVRPALWSTLTSGPAGRFSAVAYGGRIEGTARAGNRQATRLEAAEVRVDGVDLAQVAAIEALTGGRILGILEAAANVELAGELPAEWTGRARLVVSGLDLQNVALGGLTMEHLPLGHAEVELELQPGSGEVRIVRCEVGGSEVDLTGSGRILLAADLPRSRLEVQLRLRFSGRTQETMGDAVTLMGFGPDENGWIRLAVEGTLQGARVLAGR